MQGPGRDNPLTDQRLEDHAFFQQEVMRLMDRLYGTALRLTRDPDDAEDIVAEAIGKAWARRDQLRDRKRLEGWLFQILNNTFVSAWRRRQARPDMETGADPTDADACDAAEFSLFLRLHQPFLLWWGTAEDRFLNDLLHADIEKALDALPDVFRVVIVLVEVQGHTYDEVSQLLGIPIGTVRSRLSRARGLLQMRLWDHALEAGLVKDSGSNRTGGGRS